MDEAKDGDPIAAWVRITVCLGQIQAEILVWNAQATYLYFQECHKWPCWGHREWVGVPRNSRSCTRQTTGKRAREDCCFKYSVPIRKETLQVKDLCDAIQALAPKHAHQAESFLIKLLTRRWHFAGLLLLAVQTELKIWCCSLKKKKKYPAKLNSSVLRKWCVNQYCFHSCLCLPQVVVRSRLNSCAIGPFAQSK